MTVCSTSHGMFQVPFAKVQSSVTAPGALVVGDALEGKLEITPVYDRELGNDANASHEPHRETERLRGPHTFTFTAEWIPTGTSSTSVPLAPFLEQVFSKTDTAAVEINGTPTTTTFETTEAALAVNDVIMVPDSLGALSAARVTTVVNDPGVKDTVTFAPAVPTAPTASMTIAACDRYTLRTCAPADKYLTLAIADNHASRFLHGAFVKSVKLNAERGKLMIEITGEGRHYCAASTVTTTQSRDDDDTTVTVASTGGFAGVDSANPVYLKWENEIVQVTAAAAGSLTIVRAQKSTSAASHASGTEMVPDIATLTPTFTYQPVNGLVSQIAIADVAFEATKFSASLDFGQIARLVTSDDEMTAAVKSGNHAATFSADVFVTAATAQRIAAAVAGTSVPVAIGWGDTAGYAGALIFPAARITPFAAPIEPGGEPVITIDGKALGTAGSDAVMFDMVTT